MQTDDFWIPEYEEIANDDITKTILDVASVLKNTSKAHVFCQRAVNAVGDYQIAVDGKMTKTTVSAINSAAKEGLAKPLCRTTRHYAANYVESRTHPSEYKEYMKEIW